MEAGGCCKLLPWENGLYSSTCKSCKYGFYFPPNVRNVCIDLIYINQLLVFFLSYHMINIDYAINIIINRCIYGPLPVLSTYNPPFIECTIPFITTYT